MKEKLADILYKVDIEIDKIDLYGTSQNTQFYVFWV